MVKGIKTTKSKVIMTNPKTDVIAVDKNSKKRIKSDLKGLKIGGNSYRVQA